MKRLLLAACLGLLLPAVAAQDETAEQPDPPAAGDTAPPAESAEPPAPEDAGAAVGEEIGTIPVQGQPPEPLPPGPAEAQQLDELVVTAQKTRQPLRKVPLSVTALGGDFIQDTGAADLADVSLYVPNTRIDADDLGSPQVFIRGFGTNSFNPSFEGSVALVQDEIYFGRPGYFTEAMFDVDRIEVLRGPQGTLFGKNTVAGVFNVISRGPEAEFAADARYFYGEHNEHRLEAGVGGPLGDRAGARVAGLYRKQDGQLVNRFLRRNEEEIDQQAGRVKVRISPGYGIDAELMAVVSDTEAPFWPFQLMKLDDDTRAYLEGFDPDIEDDPYDFRTSFDTPGFIEKGSDTAGLKTEWAIGDLGPLQEFTSVLVLGGSRFHIDQLNELDVSPADLARLDNHEDHEQTSVELRFTAHADSLFGIGTGLEFVAGGYYFDSSYVLLARVLAGRDLGSFLLTCDFAQLASEDREGCASIGQPGIPGLGEVTAPITDDDYYRFDYDQDIGAQALFGQFTWYLDERWAVTPGVRINQEDKRVNAAGAAHCPGRAAGQPCAMEQLLSTQDYDHRNLRRDESDVSPKLAIQYFAEHDVNYYASYARGFKSGGFNSISFGQVCEDSANPATCRPVEAEELEYEEEVAQTVELGAKARFFDKTLGLNATLYATRFENLQVLAFNGVFFDVSNAATARSRGLEADFNWLSPFEPLRVMGSLGLLDARYDRYDEAPAPISQGINQTQDLGGKRIAFAPEITATLTPSLTYLFGNLVGTLAVDVLYQGDQYTDTDLDPNTRVPAHALYSARLMVSNAAGSWSAALGGSNLADERVLNQVTDAVFFPGTYYAQQASGRQLFATVTLRI